MSCADAKAFVITDTKYTLGEINAVITGGNGKNPSNVSKDRIEFGLLIWPDSKILQKNLDCFDREKLMHYIREENSPEDWAKMTMHEARSFSISDTPLRFGEINTIITGASRKVSGKDPTGRTKDRLELGLVIWPGSKVLQEKLEEVQKEKTT